MDRIRRIRNPVSGLSASSAPPSTRLPGPSAPSFVTLTRPASPQMAPTPLAQESPSPSQTAWTNLKEGLIGLRDGCDLYPPLKVALSGVTSVMDSIERVGDVNGQFVKITESVKGFQRILSQYSPEKDITPAMCLSLDSIISELKLVEESLNSKSLKLHRQTRHIIEVAGDMDEIIIAFERFRNMIDKLLLEMSLYTPDYYFIFGGTGGAGGISERGTGGDGGIGGGPILNVTNSIMSLQNSAALMLPQSMLSTGKAA
ncbi:hypothetical protein K438DRAFT_1998196 [Mycena galopus ATCC 62051]|nr:hypothetical protein K438DRAFT_1998196 [Mycena galopus ATCC 62051]